MRTKIAVLSAAVLVAGLVAASAQVYSQNYVGYIQYTNKVSSPGYEMVANPLDNGTNTILSLFPTSSIPGGTTLQGWNGAGYDQYSLAKGVWTCNATNANNHQIPPGVGFFIQLPAGRFITNTYVGNVVPPAGQSVSHTLTNITLQPMGLLVPIADYATNPATVNLIMPGGTTIQMWNIANQGFDLYSLAKGVWTPRAPFIGVGQGFFISASATTNWIQTLHTN